MPWEIEERLVHKGPSDETTGVVRLQDGTELVITDYCVSPPVLGTRLHPDHLPTEVRVAQQRIFEQVAAKVDDLHGITVDRVVAWLEDDAVAIGSTVTVVLRFGNWSPTEKISYDSPVVEITGSA